jgi:hypothetical protein
VKAILDPTAPPCPVVVVPTKRDFCLDCALPIRRESEPMPCACGVWGERLRDLEQSEREGWQEYGRAEPLVLWHLRLVAATGEGPMRVADLLRWVEHPDVVRELPARILVQERELVQLVYQKHCGCRLLRWRLF